MVVVEPTVVHEGLTNAFAGHTEPTRKMQSMNNPRTRVRPQKLR